MTYNDMIFSLIFLFVIACRTNEGMISDGSKYHKALSIIKNKEQEMNLDVTIPPDLVVSDELVNFRNFSLFFEEIIKERSSLTTKDLLFDPKKIVMSVDSQLIKYGAKKKSDNYLFFSNEIEGMFFAEVFLNTKIQKMRYQDKPHFGVSYVYLFKFDHDNVKLLRVKEMSYG